MVNVDYYDQYLVDYIKFVINKTFGFLEKFSFCKLDSHFKKRNLFPFTY